MLKIQESANQTKTQDQSGEPLLAHTLPWEDAAAYEKVREAVWSELQPSGLHQETLAADILAVIWEQFRYRDTGRCLSKHAYRQAVIMMINDQNPLAAAIVDTSPAHDLADRLLGSDTSVQAEARKQLKIFGIDEDDVKAKGFLAHIKEDDALHRKVLQLSDRRRAPLREFNGLKEIQSAANDAKAPKSSAS